MIEDHPEAPRQPHVHALVLAAGRSARMAGRHKLLARLGGRPLVRIAVDAAVASMAKSVTVVVGHQAAAVGQALEGIDVTIVENPAFATGLAGSLRAGIAALPTDADGAIVVLADMPDINAGTLDRLIDAFGAANGRIVVPTFDGRPGNPVVWPRDLFPALATLHGDRGGRDLVRERGERVAFVEIGPEVARDIATPEEMLAAGGEWS